MNKIMEYLPIDLSNIFERISEFLLAKKYELIKASSKNLQKSKIMINFHQLFIFRWQHFCRPFFTIKSYLKKWHFYVCIYFFPICPIIVYYCLILCLMKWNFEIYASYWCNDFKKKIWIFRSYIYCSEYLQTNWVNHDGTYNN